MPGLSELISAASQDPPAIVLGLALIGTIAAQVLARKYPLVRAGIRVVFLALLTIVFVRAGIVPYKAQSSIGDAFLDLVHRILKIVWWFWAAWFVVDLLRTLVILERLPREGRLLQDLLAGIRLARAPSQQVAPARGISTKGGRHPEELIELVAIFRSLTVEERGSIVSHLKYASHDAGTLVQAGEVIRSLFIIAEGVVAAVCEPEAIELGRMGPGDHLWPD